MPIPEESTMEDLKPCPFCWDTNEGAVDIDGNEGDWSVGCCNIHCLVQPRVLYAESLDEAVRIWNTRAHP